MKPLEEQGFVAVTSDAFDVAASLELAREICDALNENPDAKVWVKRSTRERDGVTVECAYSPESDRVWIHQSGNLLCGSADTDGDVLVVAGSESSYYNTIGQRICCYSGCYRLANSIDDDGDVACASCASRSFSWVEYVNPDGLLADPAMAKAYVGGMENLGYTVEASLPPNGTSVGTYYRSVNGQVFPARGLEALETYEADSNRIYNALCQHSGEHTEDAEV